MDKYEDYGLKDIDFNYLKQEDKTINPCDACPNNPKNGGSGVCFCTLGLQNIRW